MGPAGNAPFLETSSNYKGHLWISWKRTLECEDSSTLARVTYSGKETYLPQLSLILRDWPRLTSRATLARSSTTSTRPPTLCSPTCPRVTQEARQIQVRLEDAEENPTRTLQGRCRRTYCEEDNHAGSVRDPRECTWKPV